ncbi:hypothetical protein C9426_34620 [Serratia sp. S1B]|nr:hypothetical protein C9426_34620 [Serratia sp. S1B]
MKKAPILLLMIFSLFPLFSYSQESRGDDDHLYVQMQTRIQKGEQINFTLFFKEKPEDKVVEFPNVTGLARVMGEKNIVEGIGSAVVLGYEYPYAYYGKVKATEAGEFVFPPITITVKGKQYQSSPFNFKVLDNMKFEPDDILLKLSTDKEKVKVGEPLTLTLNLYSVFDSYAQLNDYVEDVQIKGEGNTITNTQTINIDKLSGVENLKDTLTEYFTVEDYDVGFSFDNRMSEINGKRYFKKVLLELNLVAKKEGIVNLVGEPLPFHLYADNSGKISMKLNAQIEPIKIKIIK